MIFNGVKLPDQIGFALEEERLVVFAGAGVSLPPPSKIPLFNGLASQISGGLFVTPGREDRFLGKIARSGTDVHMAATQIVYNNETRPTQLHSEILRIFKAPDKVRLVTTNFDNHFTTAGHSLFGKESPIEFYAPALPLGDNFAGLVYLHGSARMNPSGLVLTDKDYGAAYLTRGWARDFLVSLFSKYTVLFIGYSHSDVTTTYLARGLNQAEIKPRWTMVSSEMRPEGRENWEHLEISVVEYPVTPTNTDNTHQALTDFFSLWADHAEESLFARAKRVKEIARGLPPESDTVSEYLAYCLRHPRLAQDFTAAIRQPAWVGWLHEHGYFNIFFADRLQPSESEGAHHRVLANWLCSYVRRHHPELLLDIFATHRQQLTPFFSNSLAHLLWIGQKKKSDRRFAAWVSVLLAQGRTATSDSTWAYLLNECRLPKHLGIALRLFEILTSPEIKVELAWNFDSPIEKASDLANAKKRKPDFSLGWSSDARHWIEKAWITVFKPHLPKVADLLAPIVLKQLSSAHLLLRGVGKANDRYDRLSLSRSSIAPHEQDDSPLEEVFSWLVDMLREILQHWISTNPARARVNVEMWWSTRQPILKRVAAYAHAVDPQYSAEERIEWLLSNDLIFRSGMKKEVYDVLTVAYPNALPLHRRRLLRRINRGYSGPGARRLDPETIAYEKFNVLVWLRKADPTCALVQPALAEIKEAFPVFAEREHPDFDHWHGKVRSIDPNEGVDFDRILGEPPRQYLTSLLTIGDNSVSLNRWDYFSSLSVLFSRSRTWSEGFVAALAAEAITDEHIWSAVFSAWRETVKTGPELEAILPIIESLPQLSSLYSHAANFLAHKIWQKDVGITDAMIERVAALMDTAWALCSAEEGKPGDNYREWLTSAINHVGGWIGEFWVYHASHLRTKSGHAWRALPDTIRTKMVEALEGTNQVRVYARIALTPWMGHLFVWDRDFAIVHFLPLLDWQRDPVVAQQSWSVLLNYNRGTSRELETELIPYYRQFADQAMNMLKRATEKSEQFDSHALHNLGYSLAGLAMQVISDPVENGFFRDFLPLLPDVVRAALARGMENQLKQLDDFNREKLWITWLKKYLDLRLVGVPVALSVGETKHILEWCLYLGSAFPEAVERITKMPLEKIFAYSVVKDLLENKALARFPLDACRLASAALRYEDYPMLHTEAVTLHDRLKHAIPGTPELTTFEELLYVRGWEKK